MPRFRPHRLDLQGLKEGVQLLDMMSVIAFELLHTSVRQALTEDIDDVSVDRR